MCLESELRGFIEAKTPSLNLIPNRKKSNVGLWKNWKKYSCTVTKSDNNFLEMTLERVTKTRDVSTGERQISVKIPGHSMLMRIDSKSGKYAFGIFPVRDKKPLVQLSTNSETESQGWMESLRTLLRPRRYYFENQVYSVSIVDNQHSRGAGLHGLHGDLVANCFGVFIRSPHTGEIRARFQWNEIGLCHLANYGKSSDVKRIVVVHTSEKFRNGVGELHFFCHQAGRLLKQLVTEGRGPKNQRRLLGKRPACNFEIDLSTLKKNQEKVKILKSLENVRLSCEDIVRLGVEKEENDYHRPTSSSAYREPIYTEIEESCGTWYENVNDICCLKSSEEVGVPPPLPPRHQQNLKEPSYEFIVKDDCLDSESSEKLKSTTVEEKLPPIACSIGILENTDNSKYVCMSTLYSCTKHKKLHIVDQKEEDDSSEYVVMSPQPSSRKLQENVDERNKIQREMIYVVMR